MTGTLYNTLLLDTVAWDLVLDANGDIAMAAPPYAVAQDVASAARLFLGELWYDTTQGVPYWQELLGFMPTASVVEQALNQAALSVSGVVSATTVITEFSNRKISGQIQFTTTNGTTTSINF